MGSNAPPATIPGATQSSIADGTGARSSADANAAPSSGSPNAIAGGTLVEIAVTTAAPGLYHYRIPPHLGGRAYVGSRVLVRFGAKRQTGVVVRAGTPAPPDVAPLDVSEVLDVEPSLSSELVDLCLWIANYYEAPAGEALKGALPAGSGVTARLLYAATTTGEKAIEGEGGALPPKQRAMLAKIVDEELPSTGLTAAQRTTVEALVASGLVELRDERSASTRLRREKWVRVVGELADARAKVKRGPKRIAVMNALAAMMCGEAPDDDVEVPGGTSNGRDSDNTRMDASAEVPGGTSSNRDTDYTRLNTSAEVPGGTSNDRDSDDARTDASVEVPRGTSSNRDTDNTRLNTSAEVPGGTSNDRDSDNTRMDASAEVPGGTSSNRDADNTRLNTSAEVPGGTSNDRDSDDARTDASVEVPRGTSSNRDTDNTRLNTSAEVPGGTSSNRRSGGASLDAVAGVPGGTSNGRDSDNTRLNTSAEVPGGTSSNRRSGGASLDAVAGVPGGTSNDRDSDGARTEASAEVPRGTSSNRRSGGASVDAVAGVPGGTSNDRDSDGARTEASAEVPRGTSSNRRSDSASLDAVAGVPGGTSNDRDSDSARTEASAEVPRGTSSNRRSDSESSDAVAGVPGGTSNDRESDGARTEASAEVPRGTSSNRRSDSESSDAVAGVPGGTSNDRESDGARRGASTGAPHETSGVRKSDNSEALAVGGADETSGTPNGGVSAEMSSDELELVRDEVPLEELAARVDGAKPVVRELVKAGILEVFEREAQLEAVAIEQGMSVSAPHELTAEQAHAVAEITSTLRLHTASGNRPHGAHVGAASVGEAQAGESKAGESKAGESKAGESKAGESKAKPAFRPFLLFGVTGSGKTEVYLRVIHEALALGKTALVLVPEISLTPQLAARFRARFGDSVAILHSGLSEQARLGEWSRLRRGDARIAVGARSAVFAPLENIGVIVVDEEHDGSFKQDEGVKYHGRDVALVRAQRAGAVCVLGSGTPSLESNAQAERGAYEKLVLTQRPKARPMPSVDIIDLRMWQPDGDSFLAAPLRTAIEETLAAGDQIILFLNRRGFSTFIVCVSCGHAFRCPNCSVSLTYHRHGERLTCHYCNYSEGVPTACPKCNSTKIERKGLGTEKIAASIAEQFPQARVARLDRDVASGARAQGVLGRVARREVDLLVGTQMVTKGHDFPGVTLVGVLCADTGLNLPDFRASERTFQLLAQVAGRAGRGDKAGKVLIQTYRPEAPAVVAAALHDYERFYAAEVEERRETHYPPHGRLIVVRVDGPDEHEVAGVAHKIAMSCDAAVRGMLRQRATKLLDEAQAGAGSEGSAASRNVSYASAARGNVSDASAASGNASAAGANGPDDFALEILGPTAAPLARLRGRSRWQIWVRGTDRAAIRWVARHALTIEHASRVRVTLDVDPNSAL